MQLIRASTVRAQRCAATRWQTPRDRVAVRSDDRASCSGKVSDTSSWASHGRSRARTRCQTPRYSALGAIWASPDEVPDEVPDTSLSRARGHLGVSGRGAPDEVPDTSLSRARGYLGEPNEVLAPAAQDVS